MYGSGLRISEVIRLRVKDIDFDYKQIILRSGKGDKDRVTIYPEKIATFVQNHPKRYMPSMTRTCPKAAEGLIFPMPLPGRAKIESCV